MVIMDKFYNVEEYKKPWNYLSDYSVNDLIKLLQDFSDLNNNPKISYEEIKLLCWDSVKQQRCAIDVKNKC